MRSIKIWLLATHAVTVAACGNLAHGPRSNSDATGPARQSPAAASPVPVADHDPDLPQTGNAVVAANPTAPATDDGKPLGWSNAPLINGVVVSVDRDSVIVTVPAVNGAADYRVFALPSAIKVTTQGIQESVGGTDIYCAGNRQYNAAAPANPVVMQQIEVFNLQGPTRLVIEAVDRNCPFVGLRASAPYKTQVTSPEVPASDHVPVVLYTDDQIRASYKNAVIFNGHGAAATLAAAAPDIDPVVLGRTTITVTPLGNGMPEVSYFDDFSHPEDVPVFVQSLPTFSDRNSNAQLLQNAHWDFYQTNFDHADLLIDRGQLQMTVLDRYQDVFATNFMVARHPVQLGTNDYVHVTYTVNSDATQRRYWWMFMCGAAQMGATLDSDGKVLGHIVETPFFYQPDGRNPSVEGWNCLQIFPRDGTPFPLPPSNQRPQSDIRVMVNVAGASASVVNVSPNQYAVAGESGVANSVYGSWYRQQNGKGQMTAPILDDQMFIAPRTRYDVYVSRTRAILFVNGQQRLCNDFPKQALTMAEAALGLGQVLYHSTAERLEFSDSFDNRTGQRYYLTNTPYADVRSWDNVGYQEHTRAPSYFDATQCYVYQP